MNDLTIEAMHRLVTRLERIAKLNNDEFTYKVEVRAEHGALSYCFVCEERAEKHAFVSGSGSTILDALDNAALTISGACHAWNYKLPASDKPIELQTECDANRAQAAIRRMREAAEDFQKLFPD